MDKNIKFYSRGVTLVESLISVLIIVVVAISFAMFSIVLSKNSVYNKMRTIALSAAQKHLEDIVSTKNYYLLDVCTSPSTVPGLSSSTNLYDPNLYDAINGYDKNIMIYPMIERIDKSSKKRAANQITDTGFKRVYLNVFWNDSMGSHNQYLSTIVEKPNFMGMVGSWTGCVSDSLSYSAIPYVHIYQKDNPLNEIYSHEVTIPSLPTMIYNFKFSCEPGYHTMVFEKPGYFTKELSQTWNGLSCMGGTVSLTPISTGTVSGEIYGYDGTSPDDDIALCWIKCTDGRSDPVYIASPGTFNIFNVSTGTYNLYAIALNVNDGKWYYGYCNGAASKNESKITLTGSSLTGIGFNLVDSFNKGLIYIKVTNYTGTGLEGNQVTLVAANGNIINEQVTSNNGICLFEVDLGTYTVLINRQREIISCATGSCSDIEINSVGEIKYAGNTAASYTDSTNSFMLDSAGSYTGYVKSKSGERIPNVDINVYDQVSNNLLYSTVTNEYGLYAIKGLTSGTNIVIKPSCDWGMVSFTPSSLSMTVGTDMLSSIGSEFLLTDIRVAFKGDIKSGSSPILTGTLITATTFALTVPPEMTNGVLYFNGQKSPATFFWSTSSTSSGKYKLSAVYDQNYDSGSGMPVYIYAWPLLDGSNQNSRWEPGITNPVYVTSDNTYTVDFNN